MTVVTLNRKELEKKIGKITKEIEEKISMFGTTVESSNNEEIQIEVYPNRPDLLSLQGVSRALYSYLEKPSMPQFKVNKPEKDYKIIVEKSLPKEWPYAVACVVKGLKLNNERIKEIIEIQEKLGMTMLRKRKKGGIGLYPLDKIKFPIKFVGKKPEEIKFRPLEYPDSITGRQILSKHPTGREYAHLCKDWEKFPIFIDDSNNIMSMPPIINSHDMGKIEESTQDVFIEATGNDLNKIQKTLNIIVTALHDMGGQVYPIECIQQNGKSITIPNLEPEKMKFKIEDINKTLGLNLTEQEIKKLLLKMSILVEKDEALIPAYRTDILHWIDLAEEVAIAYGYENFIPEIPKISTIAQEDEKSIQKRKISEILSGLGILETSSFHLTTKENVKAMHYDFKNFIEVENSKTEYNVLRPDLLTNLMKILSENSDSSYPQKIFETGKIFRLSEKTESGIEEQENLAIALINDDANFTTIKQSLDYLFKMLNKEYKIEEIENSNFISGRIGKIISNNKEIGVIGEIAPRVLKNYKLKMPVSALEINLSLLN